MITVESLRDYLTSKAEFMSLVEQIYQIVDVAAADYPNRKDWYFNKQIEGIARQERDILFVRHPEAFRQIVGLACLKKTAEEQKICHLYVREQYRGKGIGSALIERSLAWLETSKPLLTIAENKLNQLMPFIQKYGWQIQERVQGIYQPQVCELCLNGTLTKAQTSEPAAKTTPTSPSKLTTFMGALHHKVAETDLTK